MEITSTSFRHHHHQHHLRRRQPHHLRQRQQHHHCRRHVTAASSTSNHGHRSLPQVSEDGLPLCSMKHGRRGAQSVDSADSGWRGAQAPSMSPIDFKRMDATSTCTRTQDTEHYGHDGGDFDSEGASSSSRTSYSNGVHQDDIYWHRIAVYHAQSRTPTFLAFVARNIQQAKRDQPLRGSNEPELKRQRSAFG